MAIDGAMSGDFPRTVEEIFTDFQQRRDGLLRALTDGANEAGEWAWLEQKS